jgi:hypothetical protein
MAEVIAAESLTVFDEQIGISRKLFAGQAVPPDLVRAYRGAVGDAQADDPAEEADAARSYDGMSAEDLQTEADRRKLSVAGTGANGNVLKKDLVDALRAADGA